MLVIICRKDCQYLRKSCRSRNSADAEFIYKVGFGAAKIEPSKLCYKGRSPSIYTSWIPRSQPSPLFRIEARFNQLNELMAEFHAKASLTSCCLNDSTKSFYRRALRELEFTLTVGVRENLVKSDMHQTCIERKCRCCKCIDPPKRSIFTLWLRGRGRDLTGLCCRSGASCTRPGARQR